MHRGRGRAFRQRLRRGLLACASCRRPAPGGGCGGAERPNLDAGRVGCTVARWRAEASGRRCGAAGAGGAAASRDQGTAGAAAAVMVLPVAGIMIRRRSLLRSFLIFFFPKNHQPIPKPCNLNIKKRMHGRTAAEEPLLARLAGCLQYLFHFPYPPPPLLLLVVAPRRHSRDQLFLAPPTRRMLHHQVGGRAGVAGLTTSTAPQRLPH